MIKTILKSDDNALITVGRCAEHQDEPVFSYCHAGDDLVMLQLFFRLQKYVPDWYIRWKAGKVSSLPVNEVD